MQKSLDVESSYVERESFINLYRVSDLTSSVIFEYTPVTYYINKVHRTTGVPSTYEGAKVIIL